MESLSQYFMLESRVGLGASGDFSASLFALGCK